MTILDSKDENHAAVRELDAAEVDQIGGGGVLNTIRTIISILTGLPQPPNGPFPPGGCL